jgi:hypothetical protein
MNVNVFAPGGGAGGFAWSDTILDREWGPILFEAIRTVV